MSPGGCSCARVWNRWYAGAFSLLGKERGQSPPHTTATGHGEHGPGTAPRVQLGTETSQNGGPTADRADLRAQEPRAHPRPLSMPPSPNPSLSNVCQYLGHITHPGDVDALTFVAESGWLGLPSEKPFACSGARQCTHRAPTPPSRGWEDP